MKQIALIAPVAVCATLVLPQFATAQMAPANTPLLAAVICEKNTSVYHNMQVRMVWPVARRRSRATGSLT